MADLALFILTLVVGSLFACGLLWGVARWFDDAAEVGTSLGDLEDLAERTGAGEPVAAAEPLPPAPEEILVEPLNRRGSVTPARS